MPSGQVADKRSITMPTITVAFRLSQPSSSSKVDTALSVNAIELVIAANSTSTKNEPITNDAIEKQEQKKKLFTISIICECFDIESTRY